MSVKTNSLKKLMYLFLAFLTILPSVVSARLIIDRTDKPFRIPEKGGSYTYLLTWDEDPGSESIIVTLDYTTMVDAVKDSDYTLTESSGVANDNQVEINSSNWNSGAPVTVTAIDDKIAESNESIYIYNTYEYNYGSGYGFVLFSIKIEDDDASSVAESSKTEKRIDSDVDVTTETATELE